MEVCQLRNLIIENKELITSVTGYKSILNRGNNLIRFNALNRILIMLQNNNAFDLKLEEEWLILGRQIKNKAIPTYLVFPKYSSYYIDNANGSALDKNDLTSDELNKAIYYGLVSRVDTIDNMYTLPLYDVRHTLCIGENSYNIQKPLISSKNLLEVMQNIMKITIELCDEDYYSKTDKTVYISKHPYKELAYIVASYITTYIMDNEFEDIISKTDLLVKSSLGESDIILIKSSLMYSILSIFIGKDIEEYQIDFGTLDDTSVEKIFLILNIIDILMLNITESINFNTDSIDTDAIKNIDKLRKAEVILNIMEANEINKIMKGI